MTAADCQLLMRSIRAGRSFIAASLNAEQCLDQLGELGSMDLFADRMALYRRVVEWRREIAKACAGWF